MAELWDQGLIDKYNISGPRYTSYPTALQFNEDFTAVDFSKALSEPTDKPLSIYIHIPFCKSICYYCACNKFITKDQTKSERYLDALEKEIAMVAKRVGRRKVKQMHWGGGTPTFLTNAQIIRLIKALDCHFDMDWQQGEFAIEVDPRAVDEQTLSILKAAGFNRVSLGVQDFNEQVQIAVNRVQPMTQTLNLIQEARRLNFQSISVDLIYGLPFQTQGTFAETVEQIVDMRPDRISVFNYAHLPHQFKPQRRINEADLPEAAEKLRILKMTTQKLTDTGYQYIGMDHFALPEDDMAKAQNNDSLHRNFQGYTTHKECDLVGLGVSAISQGDDFYSQNVRDLNHYYEKIESGKLAVWRGYKLTQDDIIRRAVITQLICHFKLRFLTIEKQFGIDFNQYFATELQAIQEMHDEGLLILKERSIHVTDVGRLLIRNICMQFDLYLQELAMLRNYSRAI